MCPSGHHRKEEKKYMGQNFSALAAITSQEKKRKILAV
jgi:hypothetical protein